MSLSIQLRTGIFKQLEGEFLVKLDSGHQSKHFHDGSKGKKRVTDEEHIIERLKRQQVSKKLN